MWTVPIALAAALQNPACEPLPGWQAVTEASEDKYLIFGETHGSAEAPATVAELICAVAEQGPVLLAIEFSASTNAAWQRAWAAPHAEFQTRLFAEIPEWGQRSDGVASEAMLAMLMRLHALKEGGRDIDIVAFNGARDATQRAAFAELPGQESHEAAQAANIREASQARAYAHVVVLAGNLHAMKVPITLGTVEMRPMAVLLAESDRVISLNMHVDGGETWSCVLRDDIEIDPTKPVTDEMITCRPHRTGADSPARSRGFHLDPELEKNGFDGIFALGPVTASPPPAID